MAEVLAYFGAPFIQRALLAGSVVSLLAGVLGVFVVAKGVSLFGDAVAHAALSGVALGVLLNAQPLLSALLVSLVLAFALHAVSRSPAIKLDAALGLISALGVAVGVLLISLREGYQPELLSFLFGNILAVGWADVAIMLAFALAAGAVVWRNRHRLVYVTFDPVSAHANGVRVGRVELLFEVLLTLTVVAGVRLIGVLLVNALLVVPAATSRMFSRSLRGMFLAAPALSLGATLLGLGLSAAWDLPTGPAIVAVAGLGFFVAFGWTRARARTRRGAKGLRRAPGPAPDP